MNRMEFSEADSGILVKIVKAAQGRKVKGTDGEWKEFLKQRNERAADPAKHPWTTLAAFVETFTEEADKEMVRRMIAADECGKKTKELTGIRSLAQLIELTCQHRRYKECYLFPSTAERWVVAEETKQIDLTEQEHLLSIDCEMVECEGGEKELVRVCVVNSDCKMVLDMIVKPGKPVIDYLTHITGISESDLDNVTSSLFDAQEAVLKLMTKNTILIGHGLHNDLKALKIDHLRVIDTSFIFQYQNKPNRYTASLNNICKAVLGYHFRDEGIPHDCLADAMIPMQIILHILDYGLKGPITIEEKKLDEGELCKLYFHGIPRTVSVENLKKVIPNKYSFVIEEISLGKSNFGTTFVIFKTSFHANKAFKDMKGSLGQDSYGRPQKTLSVPLIGKGGKSVHVPVKVRKMSCIDSECSKKKNRLKLEASECNGSVTAKKMKVR